MVGVNCWYLHTNSSLFCQCTIVNIDYVAHLSIEKHNMQKCSLTVILDMLLVASYLMLWVASYFTVTLLICTNTMPHHRYSLSIYDSCPLHVPYVIGYLVLTSEVVHGHIYVTQLFVKFSVSEIYFKCYYTNSHYIKSNRNQPNETLKISKINYLSCKATNYRVNK